jgi:hypothetical protein
MSTTIKLKRNSAPGAEPTPADLEVGELAINPTDGKLWSKNEDGDLVLLGGLQDGSTLPTSDPAVAGELWNDSGTVRISNG